MVGKVVWKTPSPEGSGNSWGQLSRRQQTHSQAQGSGLVAEPCPLWAAEAPGTQVLWTVLGPGTGLLHRACLGSLLWERELVKAMARGTGQRRELAPHSLSQATSQGSGFLGPPRQLWLLGGPGCTPAFPLVATN